MKEPLTVKILGEPAEIERLVELISIRYNILVKSRFRPNRPPEKGVHIFLDIVSKQNPGFGFSYHNRAKEVKAVGGS